MDARASRAYFPWPSCWQILEVPIHTGLSRNADLGAEAIRRLAEQARACTKSPEAPDGRGWGAPDWRDSDAYPTANELDDMEWRWEYLRRRHGFRADWLRLPDEFAPATRE